MIFRQKSKLVKNLEEEEKVLKEETEEKKENIQKLEQSASSIFSEPSKINCKIPLDYYDTLKIIGIEEMSKIEINDIRAQNEIFTCPKCSAIFVIEKNNLCKYLTCNACKSSSCRICLEDAHKELPCKFKERQNVVFIRNLK